MEQRRRKTNKLDIQLLAIVVQKKELEPDSKGLEKPKACRGVRAEDIAMCAQGSGSILGRLARRTPTNQNQTMPSLFGRIIRAPLGLLPKSLAVPVVSGPLKGARWIVGAGPHGCWLGSYECGKPRQMARMIEAGFCVFDIGANAGYYTLLASRCVGPSGRVLAFEPLPHNMMLLREHVRINNAKNVTVIPAAVSDREGVAQFSTGHSPLMGRLSDRGDIEVATVTIDGLIGRGEVPPPNTLKIDVEGAEAAVLAGAEATIRRFRPSILLAGHGTVIQQRCVKMLESFDYRVEVDPETGHDGNYESVAIPLD